VGHAHTKTVEIIAPASALTPCILDDDPAQGETLAAMVEELGYESIPTSDPEEALKCVRYGRSRLLLADPGIQGCEFIDRALRTDPGVHVIVMSAAYTLDSALEAIRRGATDFLPKPIERNRLKRTLDEPAALVIALDREVAKALERMCTRAPER
jgi:DNA-binding NtrC family response regulator